MGIFKKLFGKDKPSESKEESQGFEKVFPDGSYVRIKKGVIGLYYPDGSKVKEMGDFYYFDEERGYGCKTEEAAADLFHQQFYPS